MELRPLVCLCLLTLSSTTSAEENGPTVVKVEQDRDVILPCSLSKENIELKLFDWKKAAEKDEKQREVFFYDAGIHYNSGRSGQSDEFKGRVSHFPEELKHGNASIIITNTKMTDSGNYTCHFPRLQPQQTFHIKLVVDPVLKDRRPENITGAAPEPYVKSLLKTKDRALLQCAVHGNPQPKVEWRDSAGNKLPAEGPQVSKKGSLFYVTLNITVTKTDSYHCVATQVEISHEISSVHSEYISEPTVVKVFKGHYIILPCSLRTKANIESELFEWRKDGQKEVFMFDGGKHSRNGHGSQSEEFKGRVAYFPKKLKHGDASITITNTKMSDRGNYTCEFPNLQPRQTFHIELVVVDIGETEIGDESESTPGWIIAVSVLCTVGVGVGLLLVLMFFGCITCGRNKGSRVPQS